MDNTQRRFWTCHSSTQRQACLSVVGVDSDLSHGWDRDAREGHSSGSHRRLGAGRHGKWILCTDEGWMHPLCRNNQRSSKVTSKKEK